MSFISKWSYDPAEKARLRALPSLLTHAFNIHGWAMEEVGVTLANQLIYDIGRIDPKTGRRELDLRKKARTKEVDLVLAETLTEDIELRRNHEEYIVVGYAPRTYHTKYEVAVDGLQNGYPVGTSLPDQSDVLKFDISWPPIIVVTSVSSCMSHPGFPTDTVLWGVHRGKDGEYTLKRLKAGRGEVFFRHEFRDKQVFARDRWWAWTTRVRDSATKYSGKLQTRREKGVSDIMRFQMNSSGPWSRESEPVQVVSKKALEKVFVSTATGLALGLAGEAPLLSETSGELDPTEEAPQNDMEVDEAGYESNDESSEEGTEKSNDSDLDED